MQQRVTIKDIARKTGTSVTSVHRALYGRAGISESLRHRILTEVERSNYQVDEAASLLRRKQYHIVVLLPKPGSVKNYLFFIVLKSFKTLIYRRLQIKRAFTSHF